MYLTKKMFEENLNTKFWLVEKDLEPYAMDLVECVNEYTTPRQEQFSLRFRGDRAQIFPQRIYAMKHEAMGEFELFLVPVGRDDSGTLYEAVFNRFIDQKPEDQKEVQRKAS